MNKQQNKTNKFTKYIAVISRGQIAQSNRITVSRECIREGGGEN